MKKLLINKESIVLVTGKANHSREVTLPFYLADITPCIDNSSCANSPYCVIDLAESPTKSLRMTFEPGIIIRHISAVYQTTNIYRYNANSNPMLSMRQLSAEPLTDSDIITACVQLSDVEDIPLESAIVTGIDQRNGNHVFQVMPNFDEDAYILFDKSDYKVGEVWDPNSVRKRIPVHMKNMDGFRRLISSSYVFGDEYADDNVDTSGFSQVSKIGLLETAHYFYRLRTELKAGFHFFDGIYEYEILNVDYFNHPRYPLLVIGRLDHKLTAA